MNFKFKIQQYQTDAVEAVVQVFNGQPHYAPTHYIRDLGRRDKKGEQFTLQTDESGAYLNPEDDTGFRNAPVELSDDQLLQNIRTVQTQGNLHLSPSLVRSYGRCSLDVEMETGTGKTYVYIKTMFELHRRYGWSKFMVVVPSIAIREGVKKSFEITASHFMDQYGKKARFFVYNSANLTQIDTYSSSPDINVMIINMQAFNTSLKEGAKNKEARIIYSERDEFASRRPIDVIAANHPIVIMDEPQKMGGDATQKAIRNFKPLFTLNYSATHKEEHNLVYVLDALDAYNKRLVKKIEVKGFEVKNLRGTDKYLFLEDIVLSGKKPPVARIELEVSHGASTKRELHKFDVGDDLYVTSNRMEQYKEGYTVSEIDPDYGRVVFLNGEVLEMRQAVGDVSEKDMRRIQIRETILSHFEKEEKNFARGIKTLSLFFIDEVAKYRQYDENGEEQPGEYAVIFEQEYQRVLRDYITWYDTPYNKYLKEMCADASAVHRGYFSIDKKTGHSVNSALKRGSEFSDDISAYDLILKNKERLLSFDEPTRFIFSHSALREGWDNPNVFQICTLKHSDSNTAKRQEVGRGLRLCVDTTGNRMDAQTCGDTVHDVNVLTVIASESYKDFVTDLQADIKKELYERPTEASEEYFLGKTVLLDGQPVTIDKKQANQIYKYLIKQDYIDDDNHVTDSYREDLRNGTLAPLPETLQPVAEGVHKLIQGIFDKRILDEMIRDAGKPKVVGNPLNANFSKKEFQALWDQINHKYAYTVSFDSNELIKNAIGAINNSLFVSELQYTTTIGRQKDEMRSQDVDSGASFGSVKSRTRQLEHDSDSQVEYDLIGKIAEGAVLTRRTVVAILKGMREDKQRMFAKNPEEFITSMIRLINEQKATLIVDAIRYNRIDGTFDNSIFTLEKSTQPLDQAFRSEKAIQDYVFTDGYAKNGESTERRFVSALESAEEVVVYAKLPKGFSIPTPVGNYSPDWAIAFQEGSVKHIYFVAETKGSMSSLQFKGVEGAKISCARKLFNESDFSDVRYEVVDSYDKLLSVVRG